MVKIATWNVNSVRARLEVVVEWLRTAEPDVVLLQETKVAADQFPGEPIEALGYRIEAVGETTGRGKCDRHHRAEQPVKDIYLYPLQRGFRGALGVPS